MKKKGLQYSVIICNTSNRAETDYQPQPIELGVSFPYLKEPNKNKGSGICLNGIF